MSAIEKELEKRILVLDGGMGTMLQRYKLGPEDYRGDSFKDHAADLTGNADVLCLTRPKIIKAVHEAYFEAGADIIESNTFSANRISQIDYKLEDRAYDLAIAGARIAREVADEFTKRDPSKPRFVAGSMGPTNRTASISPKVEDPSYRNVNFDQLVDAYDEMARGLIDGGSDFLLVETIFDTLNAKAALFAIENLFQSGRYKRIPVVISGTITDKSGRTLSGQTLAAFFASIVHVKPMAVSLNCALGVDQLREYVVELDSLAKETRVMCYPNAGLPNEMGEYDHSPAFMSGILKEMASNGLLNLVGGCCGTTPDHIHAIAEAMKGISPRKTPLTSVDSSATILSGLEPFKIDKDSLFVNVGERCNVAGSRRFAKMILNEKYEDALMVAREQVDAGAQILDINLDEGMLDSKKAMTKLLNLIASEPDISRVPIMIDSSDFEVIEAGLKCVQGKGIVNSISLKQGEEQFLMQAKKVKLYGAAVVVMAFDEEGQAATADRKYAICKRAYDLLVEKAGYNPSDIIFDPNILSIATGIEEHNNYAVEYFNACKEIKKNLKGARISGGLSNVSFSFRGIDALREAMHSVFLYHAIPLGMDMGIVNAGKLPIYSEIDEKMKELIENVIMNKGHGATEALLELAQEMRENKQVGVKKVDETDWRKKGVMERLEHALVKGLSGDFIETDVDEARILLNSPLSVIEGPLMKGMGRVGTLFGSGQMFLPQVIKSARVMKRAVAHLVPYLEAERKSGNQVAKKNPKILMATVKGDVHDIGKNIVGVVLACNSYEVVDLGINCSADAIVKAAIENEVDVIGLSGLITPSLEEMVKLASVFEKKKLVIPILVGGATTSKIHTAVKIAPHYTGPAVHVLDASRSVVVCNQLLDSRSGPEYIADIREEYQKLKQEYEEARKERVYLSLEEARKNRLQLKFSPVVPQKLGVFEFNSYDVDKLVPLINWHYFFSLWQLKGTGKTKFYPELLNDERVGEEATKLFNDAQPMLKEITVKGVVGLFKANSIGDDIEVYSNGKAAVLHGLRQQAEKSSQADPEDRPYKCLSDYIAPKSSKIDDYVGVFACTANWKHSLDGDDYNSIMAKSLCDRVAEAFAEELHRIVRTELWGYAKDEKLTTQQLFDGDYIGIRPAPGYPPQPDHREKKTIWGLCDVESKTGISLTESFMMDPVSSVCGLYFGHPEAKYFSVGKVLDDQIADYAERTGEGVEKTEKWLPKE